MSSDSALEIAMFRWSEASWAYKSYGSCSFTLSLADVPGPDVWAWTLGMSVRILPMRISNTTNGDLSAVVCGGKKLFRHFADFASCRSQFNQQTKAVKK
jgi:hypothetical protein